MLVPTNKSKGTLKKYKELWNKIRNTIKSKTNDSDNCDYYLPLKKIQKLGNIIIVVRSISHFTVNITCQFFCKNLIVNPSTRKIFWKTK